MTIESKTSSQDITQLFNNSRQFQIQIKLKLWRRIVATVVTTIVVAGSSRRVQEGDDEVVSWPAALL
jgi:hypothetical protein